MERLPTERDEPSTPGGVQAWVTGSLGDRRRQAVRAARQPGEPSPSIGGRVLPGVEAAMKRLPYWACLNPATWRPVLPSSSLLASCWYSGRRGYRRGS